MMRSDRLEPMTNLAFAKEENVPVGGLHGTGVKDTTREAEKARSGDDA